MFLFCLVFAMFCARLFICASWSPAGKGLTSWLSFVVSSVSLSLSHWYPGSGVVLDCIDSWSLQPYLLCPRARLSNSMYVSTMLRMRHKTLIEFHQILFMHWYWLDLSWDCYTSFSSRICKRVMALDWWNFVHSFVSAQYFEKTIDFFKILYMHWYWQDLL